MNDLPPLYHGTTSAFLPQIEEHGLGGFDIITDLGVLDELERLVETAESELEGGEWWTLNGWFIRNMIDQKHGAANWRHGQLYLSASNYTASVYTNENRFGSEAITQYFALLDQVNARRQKPLAPPTALQAVSALEFRPILLEIRRYDSSLLRSENGGSPDKILELIRKGDPRSFQQLNFEYRGVIPWSGLSVLPPVS